MQRRVSLGIFFGFFSLYFRIWHDAIRMSKNRSNDLLFFLHGKDEIRVQIKLRKSTSATLGQTIRHVLVVVVTVVARQIQINYYLFY